MPLDPTADIAFCLKDAGGKRVVYGAQRTWGIKETVDQVEFETGQTYGQIDTLLVETRTLTGLSNGSAITHDGTSYTIRDHRREGDGALTRIMLKGA